MVEIIALPECGLSDPCWWVDKSQTLYFPVGK